MTVDMQGENNNPQPPVGFQSIAVGVPLLETERVCKDFVAGAIWGARVRVVDNVCMKVHAGEIRGILGESGSGKTTLARCILWLARPSCGIVRFDGTDLATLTPSALRAKRREFQMVFQNPFESLNPAMTVEEILGEPLDMHKRDSRESKDRRIRELMETVSLDLSLLRRHPAELSGGQQQRVAIARGLALKPRLLIADEPVSALDASVQAQILNLLAALQALYGLTLILISHSLYVLHYLCSSISVMYRGRIVEEAPAALFFDKVLHPYSRLLIDCAPALNSKRLPRTYAGGKEDFRQTGPGCAFYPRCSKRLPMCNSAIPPLAEVGSDRKVACFLY